jgi:hypothetical protein
MTAPRQRFRQVQEPELAENGSIVRSPPAVRRNTSTIRPWRAKARSKNRHSQQVKHRRRLAFVGVSGVFPPKLPGVSVRTLWDAFQHEVRT